ncbi:MAG: DUF819 family protein [Bacteroidales bacterium]|nr:MAG: DUF819 family protein [Bacteroidales bacterium]
MKTQYIILLLFFILAPVIIIYLEKKFLIIKKAGAVLVCYGVGLIIGNLSILPPGIENYQNLLTNLSIPIALPLILFSLNVKKWLKIAGPALLSPVIGLFTVIGMIVLGYFIFTDEVDESWKVAGMLIGVYTGGTPNMASIKTALEVNQELYLKTHTYDLFLGAI